jgi:putative (di)nucleoside polyphosphate hydrolase
MKTPPNIADMPYRPCVGIALFNQQGRVWAGRRIAEKGDTGDFLWQLPQGGIDEGEDPREAVFRELHEETGIREARIIGEIPGWLHYDFPERLITARAFHNRGQRQRWFALLHEGADHDFDLEVHEPEFDMWRWTDLTEIPDLIIPFKRHVYEAVVKAFLPLVKDLKIHVSK